MTKYSKVLGVVTIVIGFLNISICSAAPYDSIADNMVFVKGGCYTMGGKLRGFNNIDSKFKNGLDELKDIEKVYTKLHTPHEVCLNDFYINRYEVKIEEWDAVMKPYKVFKSSLDRELNFKEEDEIPVWLYENTGADKKEMPYKYVEDISVKEPVRKVTMLQVVRFLKKLRQKTGKKYRLPTEAEWEFAARDRGTNNRWSGTDNPYELQNYAWISSNSNAWKIQKVGQKKPNSLGLYDMTGNISEFVVDTYDDDFYMNSPKWNPKRLPKTLNIDNRRVIPGHEDWFVFRGGNVRSESDTRLILSNFTMNQAIWRGQFGRRSWNYYTGLRLVLDPPDVDSTWFEEWMILVESNLAEDDKSTLNDVKTKEEKITDKNLKRLAGDICRTYTGAHNQIARNALRDINRYMKTHLGIETPTPKQTIEFLNKNKDKLVCYDKRDGNINYIFKAFGHGAERQILRELFTGSLFIKKGPYIDLNVVSYTGPGRLPMSLVDYMDLQISDPRHSGEVAKDILSLRSMSTKYLGAKNFADFPDQLKKKYISNAPFLKNKTELGWYLCNLNTLDRNDYVDATFLYNIFVTYLKYTVGINNPTKSDVLKFLNENKLVCNQKYYVTSNIFSSLYRLAIFPEFVDKVSAGTDIQEDYLNHISARGNKKPYTVLDYVKLDIDEGRGNIVAISKKLYKKLRQHGAKHFSELPANVRQEYMIQLARQKSE